MRTKVLIVAALCLVLASTLLAQDSAQSTPAVGPVVELSLIVTDKDAKVVNTLLKDQVRVFENKVEQTILSIDADERPVDCVVAIDSSGSLRSLFPAVLEASRLLIMNRRSVDEIGITRFVSRDNIKKVHEFSTDNNALLKSLRDIVVEAGLSAVIDGLHNSAAWVAEHNQANEDRRKVVVIITDGEDRNSNYKEAQLIKLLHERGVQVFAIGLVINLDREAGFIRTSPREKAEKLLKAVAEETGGRAFFPQNPEQLIQAANEISLELRAQYRIKYQSTNGAAKKGFRKVEVKFVYSDGLKRKLISPSGYYAGTTDQLD